MKKLIIAEKPSVAKDIADVIGNTKKVDNIFENDEYIISSAVGHIVELFMPEDIDANLKRWTLDTLPIIPEKFQTKPIAKNKAKFAELKKLMSRKDVDTVINACDAGREGELIFTYIYELAGCKKKTQRLWLSSMTADSIRDALNNLRDSSEMLNLQYAAKCRSEADWLIGINGTRAITVKTSQYRAGTNTVATIGRVQTPTLSMILRREHEIKNFVPKTFYRILGEFEVENGKYSGILHFPKNTTDKDSTINKTELDTDITTYNNNTKTKTKKSFDEKADRTFDKNVANDVLSAVQKESIAIVSEKKKKSTQSAPKLYDLTTLQREANTKYNMPAGMTLKIAQALYEKYKCATYPRTDSNALPEDYPATCIKVLNSLGTEYQPFSQEILKNSWVDGSNKKIFNNKKISDHFAIIPTTKVPKNLTDEESKIYNLIVRRFLAVFYPAAEFDITTRCSKVGNYEFWTEGKVLTYPGWLAVYGKSNDTEETLPGLSNSGNKTIEAKVVTVNQEEDKTRPAARYTEASLLSMMETAGRMLEDEELADAMKERGLGTPATRAQIIEHLIDLKYMERNKKELVPTTKAEGLFDYLNITGIQVLSNPIMTGEWEYKLLQMEQGLLAREEFMAEIKALTSELVEKIKNFDETAQPPKESSLISFTDHLPMFEYIKYYKSQDEKLTLNKVIGGRRMAFEELESLVANKETDLLEGFRSRIGKIFSAKLVINENNEIKFSFDQQQKELENTNELTIEKLKEFNIVGKCRCTGCDGNVYMSEGFYICEHNLREENKCPMRVGRRILEQTVSPEQMKKMLIDGKSDLLENFCSKKSGRIFAAYILLSEEGKISFEFPPRGSRRQTQN